jgi:hypothetical protein
MGRQAPIGMAAQITFNQFDRIHSTAPRRPEVIADEKVASRL